MKYWCVTGCKNTSRKNCSTSFFSDHFTDTSFSINTMSGARYLKKNAVPTILNYDVLHDITQSQMERNCISTMSTSKISICVIHRETQTSPAKNMKKDVGTQMFPRRLAPSDTEEHLRKKIKALQNQLRQREKRMATQ